MSEAAAEAPFRVQIDPKAIEEMVKDAILSSALGDKIKAAVEEALQGKGRGFSMRDPIQDAVTAEVHQAMVRVVREEYADMIRAKVREELTDERLDTLVSTLVVSLTIGDLTRR